MRGFFMPAKGCISNGTLPNSEESVEIPADKLDGHMRNAMLLGK